MRFDPDYLLTKKTKAPLNRGGEQPVGCSCLASLDPLVPLLRLDLDTVLLEHSVRAPSDKEQVV